MGASSDNGTTSGPPAHARRAIGVWLLIVAALVVVMIVVGGLTRLTHSGLSITEWEPVMGVIPPLSGADWSEAFAKYQQVPEYKALNPGLTLPEFKQMYWWEWTHRFIGRVAGVVFLIPFLIFLWRRWIAGKLAIWLGIVFLLGAAQGALGWWMVESGLAGRTDVSQYRLAAHLGLAFLLFGALFWTALDVSRTPDVRVGTAFGLLRATHEGDDRARGAARRAWLWSALFLLIVFKQIILGALVAGTDAGFTNNDWPLMNGQLVPDGLFDISPWWLNFFENVTTIQFQHRLGGYIVGLAALALWISNERSGIRALKGPGRHVFGVAMLQIVLGVWTLMSAVPVTLAAAHQLMAVALFAAALYHLHVARSVSKTGRAAT